MKSLVDISQLNIRGAKLSDLSSIVKLENQSYRFPWSEGNLKESFNGNYLIFLMYLPDRNVGHMILQRAADELHLHNVCVLPEFQRLGIGKLWMQHIERTARKSQSKVIFLEVRKTNTAAIALYLNTGFKQIGERKDYYQSDQGKENGLVFEWRL
ncbi:MAG: ribosomal protein S18-alanine N-acetyltransferase [Kangiellaceae bacterium]|nr:ribosomal protein S18-alanine N-acetyltransferase [Kangiellaceae bacterium]